MVETLEQAGPDPTHESVIAGAESIEGFQCSVCLFSATMSASDHDPAQSLQFAITQGARFVRFGALVDWEGQRPGAQAARLDEPGGAVGPASGSSGDLGGAGGGPW